MSDRTLEDRFNQLREILHDDSYSPMKRQSALKVLLKFPETKEEASRALVKFADDGQVWAIEYSIKDLKRQEDSSVSERGIDIG